jgi:hypothetical protein
VSCPSCGGHRRTAVAPGYWECRSLVEERRPGLVPDPMGGLGATMPVTDMIRRKCGVQYHEAAEGSVTLVCGFCTTFAIGLCAECAKPVCGDCSDRYQGERLCIQHMRARHEAAALAAIKARLTPERFIALASAAGNPGLRSWTIVQLGEIETTRSEGLFGTRRVVHTHVGRIGQYEISGWALPYYVRSGRLYGCLGLMLTDQGRINRLGRYIDKRGYNIEPHGEDLPTFENTDKLVENAIVFDYDFSDWKNHKDPGESIDLALRELCKSLAISV